MNLYNTLESILEYPLVSVPTLQKSKEKEEKDDNQGSLENLLQEKVQSLSDILSQIHHEIKSRQYLALSLITEISKYYQYIKSKLFETYTWEIGRNKSADSRRSQLENQLEQLNQERRQEQVKCWQDIASLRKELRTWGKQHADLLQRVRILMPSEK